MTVDTVAGELDVLFVCFVFRVFGDWRVRCSASNVNMNTRADKLFSGGKLCYASLLKVLWV